jgi:hypothetical protein
MLKLTHDCGHLTLPDPHPDTNPTDRIVLEQSNRAVMIPRGPDHCPWAYLSGYDFTEGHEEWVPGHA